MAPLRHEFGWASDSWDQLAAGIVAGHIIECGAQCTGGNCLYDWRSIPDLANVGYPLVEARSDGAFVVTKHPNTGGRVSVPTVTEQLATRWVIRRLHQPDVLADCHPIRLAPEGDNRGPVSGIKASRQLTSQGVLAIAPG